MNTIKYCILSIATLSVIACGGGGSGSNFYGGAAEIRVEVSPENIDVGDRTRVEMDVREIHDSGIILKIRIPIELTYVADTSRIFVDEDDRPYPPHIIESFDDDTFIVYRMNKRDGGDNNHLTLSLELRGSANKKEAHISVDPDVDSTTPFDPRNPEFETEAEVQVEIEG